MTKSVHSDIFTQPKKVSKIMKNLANTLKAISIAALMVSAISLEANASVHFHSVKAGGFVSQMSSAVTEVINVRPEKEEKAKFFNTTDVACSKVGAVKTYTVKIVDKKPRKNDNFKIKGVYDDSGDATATRFLNRPVNGVLTSAFGYRIHPKRKRRHFHSGVDLATKSGTPIACAGSGKVVYAGWKSGYGYVIMVDHGRGYETLYAHCSKLSATVGQTVSAGKIIAYVGRTGVATGPHLHFEVRKNGAYQNPMRYLKN